MRYQRDSFSVEAAREKGRQLPEWYVNEPEQYPGDRFYMEAFYELHSCRSITMNGPGPIPWRDIVDYAILQQIDPRFLDHFTTCIRALDNAFLEFVAEENKKKERMTERSGKTRGNRTRTRNGL